MKLPDRTAETLSGTAPPHGRGGRILPAGLVMDSVEDTGLGREIDCASPSRSIGDGEWRRILEAGLGGGAAWATA